MQKTAFVAILGCPNVGKSSILNLLLGEKVAIVSDKPQTTRTRIMGVLTEAERQWVFTDTPGLHRPRNKLGEHMMHAVRGGMEGVDACLFVTEATGGATLRPEEELLLRDFARQKQTVILALNKVDLLENKVELAQRIALFARKYDFAAVVPLSAKTGDNLDALREELAALFEDPALHISEGFFFPEDTLTDQPERVLAAELLREQLLRLLDKEIPHGTAVAVDRMQENTTVAGEAILDIEALIYCERESHKGIIIGKNGAMLKQASTQARQEMEAFFGCKVNLQCWVKVKEGWRNREGMIRSFGLND
ncbi:MAG: GTPase Era [Oscillospiraceae bacterium]|jgi:GTP-binding protein Era|nr:GTPase Era [Oscillospiraceae bacterium]